MLRRCGLVEWTAIVRGRKWLVVRNIYYSQMPVKSRFVYGVPMF